MRPGRPPGLRPSATAPGLFVEILVAAPFATKDAALGHWVELGDVVAFLTRRVAVADH